MVARAIIVAIEEYETATQIDTVLPGTLDAARRFRRWLLETKKVHPEHVLAFGAPCFDGSAEATRAKILHGIRSVLDAWRDRTDELFVFWSGHGFAWEYQAARAPLDTLVCADFVEIGSADAFIPLVELQELLAAALGPGEHYWFLDVCRNVVTSDDVPRGGVGRAWARSLLGMADCRFTMFPVGSGTAARVASDYSEVLCECLGGKGRAKGWDDAPAGAAPRSMSVTFERLFRALKDRVRIGEVSRRIWGGCEGRILTIPACEVSCRVIVEDAAPGERYEVVLHRRVPEGLERPETFEGPQHVITCISPGDYEVTLASARGRHRRLRPPGALVDLYDDAEVAFSSEPDPEVGATQGATGGPPRSAPPEALPPEPVATGPVPLRDTLAHALGALLHPALADSEGAGATPPDTAGAAPGLCLTVLGIDRLVSVDGNGPRGPDLCLADPASPEESAVYVLAAVGDGARFQAGWLGEAGGPREAQKGLAGLWSLALPAQEGERLLLWQIGDERPRATAVVVVSGRTTLIAIAKESEQAPPSLCAYVVPRDLARDPEFAPPGRLPAWARFLWTVQHGVATGEWGPPRWDAPAQEDEVPFRDWLERRGAEPMTRLAHDLARARDGRIALDTLWAEPHGALLREAWTLREPGGGPPDARLARLDPEIAWTTWAVRLGSKVPPVPSLTLHDRIAFVGATHRNLVAALEKAHAKRGLRPWKTLEVFFLSEERLSWLVFKDGPSHEELCKEGRAAESRLRAWLEAGGVAESWAIFEYDRPTMFASYWDWESPFGWVHVSPHIWGSSIATCPAANYFPPSPEFEAYVQGLAALRAMAQRRAGHPETKDD